MKPDWRPQPFTFPDPETGEIRETVSWRFLIQHMHELCQLAADSGFTEGQMLALVSTSPAFDPTPEETTS